VEVLHVEVVVYRLPDDNGIDTSVVWRAGAAAMPGIWHQFGDDYKWRSKNGGMDTSIMDRMKDLEAKNS